MRDSLQEHIMAWVKITRARGAAATGSHPQLSHCWYATWDHRPEV